MVDSWGRKFLSLNNCSCGSARKGCYILWLYSRVDSMVDSMVEKCGTPWQKVQMLSRVDSMVDLRWKVVAFFE